MNLIVVEEEKREDEAKSRDDPTGRLYIQENGANS